jgi:uncharacterized Zn finger protein
MAFRAWEWGSFPRYVSVAERRATAAGHAAKLAKKGRKLEPVVPAARGRALATTFWGRAWCDNLAAYATLANRLERGRRYLRGRLVIDLKVGSGTVTALVSGTDVYEITVRIKPMPPARWKAAVKACAGRIDSVVELLAGRFDESVMAHMCRQTTGLFPSPREMSYACTCPDGGSGSWLCKHVAATLYGVGVRLDQDPELLFRLRRVAHADLIARATAGLTRPAASRRSGRRAIESDRLSAIFGVELDAPESSRQRAPSRGRRTTR